MASCFLFTFACVLYLLGFEIIQTVSTTPHLFNGDLVSFTTKLDTSIQFNILDSSTWDSIWNWADHLNIVIQVGICCGICCCITCTLIFCKKCCCYNTCNPHRDEGIKREKVIIKIKEPELSEERKRRLSKEGKKAKQLKENKDEVASYHSCGASTMIAEGKLTIWDNILNKLPGHKDKNLNKLKVDSYDIFNEDEDNIVEYQYEAGEESDDLDEKEEVLGSDIISVCTQQSKSSIRPHAAYQFSNLGIDNMPEFVEQFGRKLKGK